MTCVVAIEHDGQIVMGGDAASTDADTLSQSTYIAPKVFRRREFLVGFSTSFRMGQILQFEWTPPAHRTGLSNNQFLVSRVIPTLRAVFKKNCFSLEEAGGAFLLGYRSDLFQIEIDYHVARSTRGYAAVGSGADVALGVCWATGGMEPSERVLTALEASRAHNATVRPPFTIIYSDEKE